jgi:Ankyrin repeats (many copies)
MPVRQLPSSPSLVHLKHQAKDLLKQHAARLASAAQKLREFHPRFQKLADEEIFDAGLSLDDAQLTIAREHGYPNWAKLKHRIEKPTPSDQLNLRHDERIEDKTFRRAVELLDAGDTMGLRELLKLHPKLVRQHVAFEGGNYFRSPTLLEFIAENPVRHGTLPSNIVEIARVILEAEPDIVARNEALALVATGSVPRERKVQRSLIDVLCQNGANPDSAIRAAAVLDEHDSVLALLGHGARMDLPVAAALGLGTECERLLASAAPADRHLALAIAAQFGHVDIVRMLLDAGEDPDRYNPPGGHSHGTPLHQAAGFGHEAVVRLLVEHGARLDQKDVLWHGTPAEWAAHEGKLAVEKYLREAEKDSKSKIERSQGRDLLR